MHPSDEDLTSYATGRISAADAERLETHLLGCDECGRRLDQINVADDPLLSVLRGVEAASSTPQAAPEQFGRYEILAQIGRGGMGVVYRAFDPQLQRPVALKVIAPGRLRAEEGPRFRREAEAAARLQHANIVQIFDFGQHQGAPFCAFELVSGGGLDARLAQGPLPVAEAAEMLAVLADAVEYAHRRQVIHRDLKPSNVLLTDDGTPKIADFGLCKVLDQDPFQTADGMLLGSPSYMAPEQARGEVKAVGPAADVYALGAILYQTLTGRAPFCGPTLEATLFDVLEKDPLPPSRLRREVDRDLETICLKCLAKDPARRYATAAALAADLRRHRDGVPILARKPSPWERAVKLARRYPLSTALSALLALALVAIVVTLWSYNLWLKQALTQAGRNLFSAQLQGAATLASTDPDAACGLLDNAERCPLELRDFAWRYVRFRADHRRPGFSQSGELRALAIGGPEPHLATGAADGTVSVWSLADHGAAKKADRAGPRKLAGHRQPITDLAFHPTERLLASSSEDGTARLWELETGRHRVVGQVGGAGCNGLCFTPDGARLATAHADGSVCVWNARSDKLVQRLTGHKESVFRVAFNCDGTRLASASKDQTIRLWSASDWRELARIGEHGGFVTDVRFHPSDATLLASSSGDRSVRRWQLDAKGRAQTLDPFGDFQQTVTNVAFSSDGRRIAAGSFDGTIHVWETAPGGHGTVYRPGAPVVAVAFDREGRLYAGLAHGQVACFQSAPGAEPLRIDAHREPITALAYLPDGPTIVSAGCDGAIRLWHADGRPIAERCLGKQWISTLGASAAARRLAWEYGGNIYTALFDGTKLSKETRLVGGPVLQTGLVLSPDGTRLALLRSLELGPATADPASGAFQMGVEVFDAVTGQSQWKVAGDIACLTFAADGSLAMAERGGCVRLVNRRGRDRRRCSATAGEAFCCLAVSPDGLHVAAGLESGEAVLCHVADNRVVARLEGHASGLTSLCFSADGKTLASGDTNGEIRLWDAVAGLERGRITASGSVVALAFAPDGSALTAATPKGKIEVWRAQ
jgi:WD40 repeat protein